MSVKQKYPLWCLNFDFYKETHIYSITKENKIRLMHKLIQGFTQSVILEL